MKNQNVDQDEPSRMLETFQDDAETKPKASIQLRSYILNNAYQDP